MIKNLLAILLIGSVGLVSANGVAASADTSYQKALNSPTAGSKQYSSGNFGDPKIIGKKGQQYYTDQELTNSANKAEISGSSSYSSRSSSTTTLTGKKDEQYYTNNQLSTGPNQATQGSKIGSNQIFNYPGERTANTAASGAK